MRSDAGTPTDAELINMATAGMAAMLNCCVPGEVISYDPTKGTAVVRPAVNDAIPSEEEEDADVYEQFPPIYNVRVVWPRARGMAIVPAGAALAPGDPVLLLCADRDLSMWAAAGRTANPQESGVHRWSCGAFAVVGLIPNTNPFPTPTDALALASKVDALIEALENAFTGIPVDGAEAALNTLAGALSSFGTTASETFKTSA